MICPREGSCDFPHGGNKFGWTEGSSGIRAGGGIHVCEDVGYSAVDAVLAGAEVGFMGVGKVVVSDDGVVYKGLENGGHVACIS